MVSGTAFLWEVNQQSFVGIETNITAIMKPYNQIEVHPRFRGMSMNFCRKTPPHIPEYSISSVYFFWVEFVTLVNILATEMYGNMYL
jgi:hypothetical protein